MNPNLKCPVCGNNVKVVVGGFGNTTTVICEICRQAWYGLSENVEQHLSETREVSKERCTCPSPKLRWKESSGWYCAICYKIPRALER